jgi:hypothetical protein
LIRSTPNFARPIAKCFTRPLLETTSIPSCIPGLGSLRSCKPLSISSRLYYEHDCRDGPTVEDIGWLQQAPLRSLVYRCDYRSDDAWKTFINEWSNRVRSYLNGYYDDPDLVGKMPFTVKDDHSTLNNASIEQVQKYFSNWIRSDEAQAEREAADYGLISFARYQ